MQSQLKLQAALLQQLINGFSQVPFTQILGLKLDHLEPDKVSLSFAMKKELIGNFMHGILHGGVISSVLDMAGGMIVMATIIQKNVHTQTEELNRLLGKCSTVDLQISYLRPGKGENFIAKAELVKSGNSISFTRMELFNDHKTLIATATGTYMHPKN